MRYLRMLLRPQWIALAVVVAAFALACFWVLAPWQLGKNTRTEKQNDLIEKNVTAPSESVDNLYRDGFGADHEWRTAILTGSYLTDKQSIVRNRQAEQRPAFEVLVPFRTTSGSLYLINRGYVRPEGAAVPAIAPPPAGQVTLSARVRQNETSDRPPFTAEGQLQSYNINSASLARAQGLPLAGGYLQILPNQPGSLGEIPLPQIDSGPYLSYGLQWLAFGIMAPVGLGYFVWAEIKARRRDTTVADTGAPPPKPTKHKQQQRDSLNAAAGAPSRDEVRSGVGMGPSDDGPSSNKLADRYGR